MIFDRFRRFSSCYFVSSPRRFWSAVANCLGLCTKKLITVDVFLEKHVGHERIHIGALLTLKWSVCCKNSGCRFINRIDIHEGVDLGHVARGEGILFIISIFVLL